MTSKRLIGFVAAAFIVGLFPSASRAELDLKRFPLSRAIPADAFIAVAARANPERAYLDEYWGEVIQAFMDSGVLDDVWDLITNAMNEEQLETVEDVRDRFGELCQRVDWCDLFGGEMVHAGRFSMTAPMGSPYQGFIMGRMDKQRAAANYEALLALMKELIAFAEARGAKSALTLTETEEDGVSIAGLTPEGAPFAVIGIARRDDIITVHLMGAQYVQEGFALLRGDSKKQPLIETKRFKNAFKDLPPAEDELVFFDFSGLMNGVSGMIKMIAGAHQIQQGPGGGEAGESAGPDGGSGDGKSAAAGAPHPGMMLITKVLDDIAVVDHIAEVSWTDGFRVFTESRTALKPGAKGKPFYEIVRGGTPARYDRFIPKEAVSFSCSSGINFTELFHYVRGVFEGMGPEGEQAWEAFERLQKEKWELDVERDVLSLIAGPIVTVEMNGNQFVLMVKVTDEQKAARQMRRLLDRLNDTLGPENGITLTPVSVAGDREFTQVMHPMLMLMGGGMAPIWGCAEGHLIIGSSSHAVDRCLKTAAGDHANITKNKRWLKEGLRPAADGDVQSVSFTDESRTAEGLQALLGGLSMGMGMAGMFVPAEAPPQARAVLQTIPQILAKLTPVAGKLDFYLSSADVTSFDGQAWHSKSVQNYKRPEDRRSSESDDSAAERP